MNIFTLLILLPLINSYYFPTPIIHNDLHGYSYRYNYNYSCLFSKKKSQEQDKNVKITPKTPGQQVYWNNLKNNNIKILLGIGPAGTGKTFLACQYAIQMLNTNTIDKIILTRPLVSTDEELGFLPGNLMKKMDPWTKPLFDALKESYSATDVDNLLKKEVIEICPLAYMRGRTFKNALIIADEMQNSTPNQMYMLVSRLGENARLVITGDLQQSDLKEVNGLTDINSRILHYKSVIFNNNEEDFSVKTGIKISKLEKIDIQRSQIVANIIHLYDCTNRFI